MKLTCQWPLQASYPILDFPIICITLSCNVQPVKKTEKRKPNKQRHIQYLENKIHAVSFIFPRSASFVLCLQKQFSKTIFKNTTTPGLHLSCFAEAWSHWQATRKQLDIFTLKGKISGSSIPWSTVKNCIYFTLHLHNETVRIAILSGITCTGKNYC